MLVKRVDTAGALEIIDGAVEEEPFSKLDNTVLPLFEGADAPRVEPASTAKASGEVAV